MSYNIQPKGDIRRLPNWAQSYITGLTNEIERQDEHIKEISSKHPGSNVVLGTRYGRPSVGLPADSAIQFCMGDSRNELQDVIEVHHNRSDNLELSVTAYGGRFSVIPWASNAVRLRLDRR